LTLFSHPHPRAVLRATLAIALCATVAEARPKIGVALGGGGARGAAHIAVLRLLEEMHIPVDYIAGTSMGAVVGGLYASGLTPDEIEKALTETDWSDALSDRTRYRDLAYRRKEDEKRYLTAIDAGFRKGRIVLPRGLQSGQKLRFLLQSYLIPVATVHDFSKLPIPFKAVAADIETGEAVVLDHGNLAEVIRASMSIPGVFSPIELDGKLLVDGGVANNVPVDVVSAMGADVVIAVDVGSPLMKREQLGSFLAVTSQVLTILTRQNAERQLGGADIVLQPPLAGFETMAFDQVRKIIDISTEYMRQQAARLEHLAIHQETYAKVINGRPWHEKTNPSIDSVSIEGSERVDKRVIRSRLTTRAGEPFDGERLRRDITRLYGLDDFQEITFSLREEEGRRGLVLNFRDKPWGPTYVRFGINTSDDLKGSSTYNFVMSVTKTRMNALGAEWRTDLRIGQDFGVVSEFYQPLDFRGRFFVVPTVFFINNTFAVFKGERRTARLDVTQRGLGLDFGRQFGEWAEFRAGVYRGKANESVNTGDPIDRPRSLDVGGFQSRLVITRVDAPTFPSSGTGFAAIYRRSSRSFGASDDYSKLGATGDVFITRGKQTLIIGAAGGTGFGSDLPFYDEFRLGGLLNLSAFPEGQIHGSRFALFRLGTYRRIHTLSGYFGKNVYAGGLFETGKAWQSSDESNLKDLQRSVGIFIGADTVLGPVIVAYARAETGHDRVYFTIGKTF